MTVYPLQAENVKKSYNGKKVVDLSIKIKKNEVVGIVGRNGSGKTTSLNLLCGVIEPDSGIVYVDNTADIAKHHVIKNKISYLTEEKPELDDLKVIEYLEYIANIYGQTKTHIVNVLDKLDLEPLKNTIFAQLSKGNRQKVLIASILVANTPIMVFDELTDGLDPQLQHQVFEIINDLKSEKTIVISSHNMNEIKAVCDRVLLMADGKIAEEIDINKIKKEDDYFSAFLKNSF